MRSPESVYADLEADRSSREGEIRFIERLLKTTDVEAEQAMLKRSLILLMYAHLECFCKFSMLSYTSAVNALSLRCSEVSYPIAAAGLTKVFAALRDPNNKHDAFRRSMPDDSKLHLCAREQIFIESFERISAQRVVIPDDLVDTKSNLSPDMLKKIMFQLGLDFPVVEAHRGNIGMLLGMRNAIAHGDRLKVPSDKNVEDCSSSTFAVMAFLQGEVYAALQKQVYLKSA